MILSTLAFLLACQAAVPPPAGPLFAEVPVAPHADPPAADVPHTDAVQIQLEVQPARGATQALRILADGRLQERSGAALALGKDYKVQARPQSEAWRTVATLDAAARARVQQALLAPELCSLQEHYQPSSPVGAPTTVVWTLDLDGAPRRVVIEGAPMVRVPALESLQALINSVRAPPAPSSIWSAAGVERIARCDANAVPALRPVIQALFDPAVASQPAAGVSGVAAVVLDIRYRNGDVETTRCRLYEDGLFTCTRDGAEVPDRRLSPSGVAGVRAALTQTRFADSSADLCP